MYPMRAPGPSVSLKPCRFRCYIDCLCVHLPYHFLKYWIQIDLFCIKRDINLNSLTRSMLMWNVCIRKCHAVFIHRPTSEATDAAVYISALELEPILIVILVLSTVDRLSAGLWSISTVLVISVGGVSPLSIVINVSDLANTNYLFYTQLVISRCSIYAQLRMKGWVDLS